MFIFYRHNIEMSTVQQGYLTPAQTGVHWPATGNVSGVGYSRIENAYSRGSAHNPSNAARQILAERAWMAYYLGQPPARGGKNTRRRRSKSRKSRRRRN
jgi:hypothetical protein